MKSVNSQSFIEEITLFIELSSNYFNKVAFLLEMRQKRNVKSESEEISIILFEHGKTLCQVENERNIDYSFEHGKGRSQAKNERNIELSFRNADLIKASLFRKNYRRIFGYAFSKKSNLFSRKIEKRFRPFARPGRLCLWQLLAGKGDLCDLAPSAGCP